MMISELPKPALDAFKQFINESDGSVPEPLDAWTFDKSPAGEYIAHTTDDTGAPVFMKYIGDIWVEVQSGG